MMSETQQLVLSPPPCQHFSVGVTKTTFQGDPTVARDHFAQFQAIHVAQAIEPAYLATLLRTLETSQFVGGAPAPGFREVESPQRAGRLLNLSLNRPELLRWLENVAGCGPLKTLEGRVVQTLLRTGDELLWHDDVTEQTAGRRVALVINLGTDAFEGGEFELRWKGGETIVVHRHTAPGSALLFRVDKRLEHRVLPLTSGGPRRVFAGWAFEGDPQ